MSSQDITIGNDPGYYCMVLKSDNDNVLFRCIVHNERTNESILVLDLKGTEYEVTKRGISIYKNNLKLIDIEKNIFGGRNIFSLL